MAIEKRLTQKIGAVGGKLHTARSRNDQIALDERLFLRTAIREISKLVVTSSAYCFYNLKKYSAIMMPGYTHTQRAQTILPFSSFLGIDFHVGARL